MTTTVDPSRLLVGISNPATMPRLLDLALKVSDVTGCVVVATHVVTVPGQIGLGSARSSPEVVAARELLQDVLHRCQDAGVEAEAVVEVGREIHEGLISAARSRDADLVLVGYSEEVGESDEGNERSFDRVMHRVGRGLEVDLVLGKFRGPTSDRILVPVESGSDFALIGLMVRALTKDRPGSVHFLDVSAGGAAEQGRPTRERLAEFGLAPAGELEAVSSDDVAGAVLARAEAFDLIVLETTADPLATDGLRGAEAERVAQGVRCSTLLVRGRPRS